MKRWRSLRANRGDKHRQIQCTVDGWKLVGWSCPGLHQIHGLIWDPSRHNKVTASYLASFSYSALYNSLRPRGVESTRLLCPSDSPGKNSGVGCHYLLQGIFLAQGLNLGLLHCRQILYLLSHQGSPTDTLLENRNEEEQRQQSFAKRPPWS